MSSARQLYQLQEIDLEIESQEQALSRLTSQLGESQTVVGMRTKLAAEQQRLEELRHQQRSLEWEIDDIAVKLKAAEESLYSGRVRNPKELSGIQQEANILKAKRTELEDEVLEIMEQAELVAASAASTKSELGRFEAEWQSQQQMLSSDIERRQAALAELKGKHEALFAGIRGEEIQLYRGLREQKGTAVAKITQGRCCGCQILLSKNELQRARSGSLVQCGSCGRILLVA